MSVGLAIHLYQHAHHSTVDHCGLIVEDNIGRPFIYELTATGPTLTPFVKRISESLAGYIVLVPLKKSGVDEISFRKALFQHALSQKKNNKSVSEVIELYKGSLIEVLAKPEDVAVSPSVDFVIRALTEAGLGFEEENRRKILCDDFMTGKYQPIVEGGKGSFQYGESVVLRST